MSYNDHPPTCNCYLAQTTHSGSLPLCPVHSHATCASPHFLGAFPVATIPNGAMREIPCGKDGFLYPGACSDMCRAPYMEPGLGSFDARTGHECCSTVASEFKAMIDHLAEAREELRALRDLLKGKIHRYSDGTITVEPASDELWTALKGFLANEPAP